MQKCHCKYAWVDYISARNNLLCDQIESSPTSKKSRGPLDGGGGIVKSTFAYKNNPLSHFVSL